MYLSTLLLIRYIQMAVCVYNMNHSQNFPFSSSFASLSEFLPLLSHPNPVLSVGNARFSSPAPTNHASLGRRRHNTMHRDDVVAVVRRLVTSRLDAAGAPPVDTPVPSGGVSTARVKIESSDDVDSQAASRRFAERRRTVDINRAACRNEPRVVPRITLLSLSLFLPRSTDKENADRIRRF